MVSFGGGILLFQGHPLVGLDNVLAQGCPLRPLQGIKLLFSIGPKADIRKWFMKAGKPAASASEPPKQSPSIAQSGKSSAPMCLKKIMIAVYGQGKRPGGKITRSLREAIGYSLRITVFYKVDLALALAESAGRRKTSKYFSTSDTISEENSRNGCKAEKSPAKRKTQQSNEELTPSSAKKLRKGNDDDDFVLPNEKKKLVEVSPAKKSKSSSSTGGGQKIVAVDGDGEDAFADECVASPPKVGGRGGGGGGGGGRERGGAPAFGRGRGGGRGGFPFGERKDPPHKGEKEVPEGAPDCLGGLTFVISGTLDRQVSHYFLEREEAEDLIKRHGGRVTGSVSKRTNFLLADEDIGGRKSSKAKELGTKFLNEDGLFDMIRKSKPSKASVQDESKKKTMDKPVVPSAKISPKKVEVKGDQGGKSWIRKCAAKGSESQAPLAKQKAQAYSHDSLTWTEKYKPKFPNDIIGNQSIVKQLHDWLAHWDERFLHPSQKGKGKKQNDSGSKKAVLMSGSPGIGKSTSAKLVSQTLGFQIMEVNASDSRGKADSKISKGIGGSVSNSIKELVSNEALSSNMERSKHPKTVLIMDEVDGMSAGDRGGIADLIASIKISKIPIICICNDRYSQKLKSLVNYCLPLNFRKPTKQQMAKRLLQVAIAEGLQVNEIALEELADRVNGDMRMALNQLQYMSLSQSVIKYDDIRARLLTSAKDEDISPFTAVDKLFQFNASKLRMDERIDLCMSDPDLVPLIIQENYVNYRPSSVGKDDNGIKRMSLIAHAAESIGDGDIINTQIRRYRQWQLSQAGSLASCMIPAALMHGQRETLESGERNFNRFGGWLGKNSTMGKNLRLLEDLHVHVLASRESNSDRGTLRLDFFTILLKRLTDPLRSMPKEDAVERVVDFMDAYSLSQEDYDTVVELSTFKGHPNPLDGIQSAVKAALTKAYKQGSNSRVVRAADLITLPGVKKAPKKRIAAMLEPVDDRLQEENGDALGENEEENSSDTEDQVRPASQLCNSYFYPGPTLTTCSFFFLGPDGDMNGEIKPQLELESSKSKGIQVLLDLKNSGSKNAKKTPTSKTRGSQSAEKAGRGSGGTKRKR
ncbi:replication factor C subunit 1 [Asimina triloba]